MVTFIRKLVNKHLFTTTVNSIHVQIAKKSAQDAMDVNNNNNIRERSLSKASFRSNFILSIVSSILYHKIMKINNNCYDLNLELRLHLDKNLRESKG